MALTGKGSRSLTVDGTAYRWSVRRKPTYCQEMGWSNLSFAVETANGWLCTLHVITEATRADSVATSANELPGSPCMAVTPALVAHSIRLALQQGWQPQQRGSAFELQLQLASSADETSFGELNSPARYHSAHAPLSFPVHDDDAGPAWPGRRCHGH